MIDIVVDEINLCGTLESRLIDLETGTDALQTWITLTPLYQLSVNPVDETGVFNFRYQLHDSADLVNPLLSSDFEVSLLNPCQLSVFEQNGEIASPITIAEILQGQPTQAF